MAARKIVRRSCLGARPRYNLVVDEDVKKQNHRPCRSILHVVAEELLHCFVIVDRAAGASTLLLK